MKCKTFFSSLTSKISDTPIQEVHLTEIERIVDALSNTEKQLNINFVCVHNSRRSQMAQLWSWLLSNYYNLEIESYSSGSEATALYPTIAKLAQEIGIKYTCTEGKNPIYSFSSLYLTEKLECFSKKYDHISLPEQSIIITVCADDDSSCPIIPNAIATFHLPFKDPKYADNSNVEYPVYQKTFYEIGAVINKIYSRL